jgi:hypothetical protein
MSSVSPKFFQNPALEKLELVLQTYEQFRPEVEHAIQDGLLAQVRFADGNTNSEFFKLSR